MVKAGWVFNDKNAVSTKLTDAMATDLVSNTFLNVSFNSHVIDIDS